MWLDWKSVSTQKRSSQLQAREKEVRCSFFLALNCSNSGRLHTLVLGLGQGAEGPGNGSQDRPRRGSVRAPAKPAPCPLRVTAGGPATPSSPPLARWPHLPARGAQWEAGAGPASPAAAPDLLRLQGSPGLRRCLRTRGRGRGGKCSAPPGGSATLLRPRVAPEFSSHEYFNLN